MMRWAKKRIRRFLQRLVGFEPPTSSHVPALELWFQSWTVRQNTYARDWSPRNVYFEFGVAGGASMLQYIRAVQRYCDEYHQDISDFVIYGFDSFAGLPMKVSQADDHRDWKAGGMTHRPEDLLDQVALTRFPVSNVNLVRGFYDDSLTKILQTDIAAKGRFPAVVTIDCDYHSSARRALDFLVPLLRSGAVFYFDDIWSFHGHPNMGELKAIHEFNESGNGQLTPCHIYGLEHHSFIYSASRWEYGESQVQSMPPTKE